jgi:hypothetical protein
MKWFITQETLNRVGTHSTRKNFKMKTKDGKPDWEAELKDIKHIKKQTYKKRKMRSFTNGDLERFTRKEREKISEEYMNR